MNNKLFCRKKFFVVWNCFLRLNIFISKVFFKLLFVMIWVNINCELCCFVYFLYWCDWDELKIGSPRITNYFYSFVCKCRILIIRWFFFIIHKFLYYYYCVCLFHSAVLLIHGDISGSCMWSFNLNLFKPNSELFHYCECQN